MRKTEQRLARLEQAMLEDVIARRFPEGAPTNGVTVICYRWENDDL